jgi:para-aminobenzoate synthetase
MPAGIADGTAPHVLLVDNHDSFTWNLAHLIARAIGRRPTVLTNDDPTVAPRVAAGDFDAIVLSPGPGRPDVPSDVGVCRELVDCDLPLLGVCLGHQLLAHVYGGAVVHAPEPVHGRTSLIHHTGTDLFASLPDPLTVMRYHSLIAVNVPDELTVTAWTDDGLVMGLAHKSKLQWGVQFHPESIASDGGVELIRAFCAQVPLGRASQLCHVREADADGAKGKAKATRRPGVGTRLTLTRRTLAVIPDPRAIVRACQGDAAWLDGSAATDHRRSIVMLPGGRHCARWSHEVTTATTTIVDTDGQRTVAGPLLPAVDAHLAALRPGEAADGFSGGFIGYLGYEMAVETMGATLPASHWPDAGLLFVDRYVEIDHNRGSASLVVLTDDDQDPEVALDEAEQFLVGLRSDVETQEDRRSTDGGRLCQRDTADDYRRKIAAALGLIRDGETYEVCLTTAVDVPGSFDALEVFRHLADTAAAPYSAFLRIGGVEIAMASPELFLSVRQRTAVSRPIKGTRPRGATGEADRALVVDLATSIKDRAENLMIVDLVRHDLGSVATDDGVSVPEALAIDTFRTVHQLVSTVSAELADGVSTGQVIASAFPGGSMTGAPKERTVAILARLESAPRGIYSGAAGWWSTTGDAELGMVIRTVVVDDSGGHVGVGGAIVALSDPDDEVAETRVKIRAPLAALGVDAARLI